MTKEQLIRNLQMDASIALDCKSIKYNPDRINQKVTQYVEELTTNVRIQNIEMCSSITIEHIDVDRLYFEITFKIIFVFKNEFSFNDKLFMIIGKGGE